MTYQLQYLTAFKTWQDMDIPTKSTESEAWEQLEAWERYAPQERFRWVRKPHTHTHLKP